MQAHYDCRIVMTTTCSCVLQNVNGIGHNCVMEFVN